MNVNYYSLLCAICLFCWTFCIQAQQPDTIVEVDYAKLPCHINKDSSIKYPTVPKHFDAYPYWSWSMTFPHLFLSPNYIEPTLAEALARPGAAKQIRFRYEASSYNDTLTKKDRKEKMREIYIFKKNLHNFLNLNSISISARFPDESIKDLKLKRKYYKRILKIVAQNKRIKFLSVFTPEQNDLSAIAKKTFLEELLLTLNPGRTQAKLKIPAAFSNLKKVNKMGIYFSVANTDSFSNIYKMSGLKALFLNPYRDTFKINFFEGISQLKKIKFLSISENNWWNEDINYSSLAKELSELNLVYLYLDADFKRIYKGELNELKSHSQYYCFEGLNGYIKNYETNLPMIQLETKNWTDEEWVVYYDHLFGGLIPWQVGAEQ